MSISSEIINVIDAIAEKLGVAIDWTAQNVIPYIKQLCEKWCQYEVYTSMAWIAIFLVAIVAFTISTPIFHSRAKKVQYDGDCVVTWGAVISWVLLIISIVVCIVGIPVQIMDIIECKVFPEKFILEQVTNMLDTYKN